MKRNSFLIDFNGLPGSGKSTIALSVCDLLDAKLLSEIYKPSKKRLLTIIKNIRFISFSQFVSFLRLFIISKSKNMVVNAFLNLILTYKTYKTSASKYMIVDQGLLQNLLSCFYYEQISTRHKKIIIKIFKSFCKRFDKKLVVNVDLPLSETIVRINGRTNGGSRVDVLCDSQKEELLKSLSLKVAVLRKIYSQVASDYINIDSSDDVYSNAERIIKQIATATI